MFKKFLYVPDNGIGICPVVLVGEEAGLAVVWKIINGVVLERVVNYSDLVPVENWGESLEWVQMLQV